MERRANMFTIRLLEEDKLQIKRTKGKIREQVVMRLY